MQARSLFNFYPFLLAVAGFGIAAVLSERALALLPADAKGALIDAFRPERWMNFLGVAVFAALLLWCIQVAWVVCGLEYTALGVWSALKVHRLKLPETVSARLIMAMLVRALGIAVLAAIYASRLSL
jgi:hypothetical protein